MKLKFCFGILFIVISLMHALPANANRYGLRFLSYNVPNTDRTTLDLRNGKPIGLGNILKLSFNMDIRNEPIFGNIFLITLDNGQSISLFIIPTEDNQTFSPTLILNDKFHNINYKLKNPNPVNDITVALTINRQENIVTASFADRECSVGYDLSQCTKATISFGSQYIKNGCQGGSDLAPIDVRDIKIERDRQPLYFWDLRSHKGDITTDMLAGEQATVANGYWLQDSHTVWKQAFRFQCNDNIQYTYNKKTHTLYIVSGDSLTSWNAGTGSSKTLPVSGQRVMRKSKYLYSNDNDSNLYSYNLEKQLITRMDPGVGVWDNDVPETDDAIYYNHAMASHGGDTLFTFGGYGFYRFYNDFHIVNTATGEIRKLDVSPLPEPRAYAGMAWVDDKLYVFGGYGNSSGRQEQPIRYFYDLWEIDLKTLKAKKLWEKECKYKTSVASQLIYNREERAFYAATLEKELIRFNAVEPGWEVVTKKIPVEFYFDVLNYSLYADEELGQVIVVVDCSRNDNEHYLNVCTVDMPLLHDIDPNEDAVQADSTEWRTAMIFVVALILLIAMAGLGMIVVRRRRRGNRVQADSLKPQEESRLQPSQTIPPLKEYYTRKTSEIKMLGEFVVLDKEGQDITAKFPSRSRNLLFVLLLSNTIKKKGIENDLLDEILWNDKTKASARNNRNVYMRRIRVLLDEIGNIDIISDKNSYNVNIGADVFFDFGEVNRLMDAVSNGEISEENTDRLLELLVRGPLLPTQPLVWLDAVKGDFSNRAISLLKSLAAHARQQGDDTRLYHIAEAIMAHDPFNEEALEWQCKILYRHQTIGIAKHVYNKFCKTYELTLGEPYTKSFNEICKDS